MRYPRARSGQVLPNEAFVDQPYAVDLDRRTERSVPRETPPSRIENTLSFIRFGFTVLPPGSRLDTSETLTICKWSSAALSITHEVLMLLRFSRAVTTTSESFRSAPAQPENQIVPIAGHVQLAVQSDVPQARNIDRMLAGLHVPDRKMSVVVGNRPQVRVDHRHDGHRNPFRRLADLHSSGYRIFLCGNAQDTNAQQQSK